jgi:NAD(P)-dependent dehydrogenase (short-subunit alcohol dehydrogenase family)
MNLYLDNHTAVIVGGARGIGLAIAREFAREKANVVLLDRDEEAAEAAQTISKDYGGRAEVIFMNVIDFEATKNAAQEALERFGRLDHIVFAVGIGSGKFYLSRRWRGKSARKPIRLIARPRRRSSTSLSAPPKIWPPITCASIPSVQAW